ncbi:hypothetical protein CLPUN_51450 [Clostridium puniceum]|uniref:Uncharacterized protein n=1 Tax=Clostridium puniceum TaxID=29367 RepID=A0A1S8SZS8_9CLOT|nr:hypothetical protein [Clostridium puniceum]OOM70881.1 hypothetical protein CLPUN_51450 [Clostridium puniceum]
MIIEYSELIHNKVKNSKLFIIIRTRHMLLVVRRDEIARLTKGYSINKALYKNKGLLKKSSDESEVIENFKYINRK